MLIIRGRKRNDREDVGVVKGIKSGTDARAVPAVNVTSDPGVTGFVAERNVVACEAIERIECERANRLVSEVAGAVDG